MYGCVELFFLKCYYRHSSLVLGNGDRTTNFLHSTEVVMQEDQLDMVAYGVGIFPLIKLLKSAYPDVMHPW